VKGETRGERDGRSLRRPPCVERPAGSLDAPEPLQNTPPMARIRAQAGTRPLLLALPLVLALPLALGCATESAPAGEPPTLYKWVDQNGVAHYTTDPERIPSNLRHRLRELDGGTRLASRPPREPATPPPGEPAPGAPPTTTPSEELEGSDTPESRTAQDEVEPGEATGERSAPPQSVARPALREGPGPTARLAPEASARSPGEPARREAAEAGDDEDPAARERRAELDARIAALEAELAAKEERLKALISETEPEEGQPTPLYESEELASLARTFPELQASLAALRAERRRLEEER